MTVSTFSPEANYLTRTNIVHPASNAGTAAGDATIAAAEVAARADSTARLGVTVSGGTIKKGR